jgi:hypothetical protein
VRLPSVVAVALAALPAAAGGLEPRFDHRDTHGPSLEGFVAHDSVAISGRPTTQAWRNGIRLAWGFDVSGEGDELMVAVHGPLGSLDDPGRERILLGADARYRAFFGTDELKTFVDVGVWVPVVSRLAVGPLVGLGATYDFSRAAGLYVSASFATGIGEARLASIAVGAGVAVRFEMR